MKRAREEREEGEDGASRDAFEALAATGAADDVGPKVGEHHEGRFRVYMAHKRQKLQDSYSGRRNPSSVQLFTGDVFWIDGATGLEPPYMSQACIKELIIKHGGDYVDTDSKNVTIVICENLSGEKVRKEKQINRKKRKKFLVPRWVTDCVEAQEKLDWKAYVIKELMPEGKGFFARNVELEQQKQERLQNREFQVFRARITNFLQIVADATAIDVVVFNKVVLWVGHKLAESLPLLQEGISEIRAIKLLEKASKGRIRNANINSIRWLSKQFLKTVQERFSTMRIVGQDEIIFKAPAETNMELLANSFERKLVRNCKVDVSLSPSKEQKFLEKMKENEILSKKDDKYLEGPFIERKFGTGFESRKDFARAVEAMIMILSKRVARGELASQKLKWRMHGSTGDGSRLFRSKSIIASPENLQEFVQDLQFLDVDLGEIHNLALGYEEFGGKVKKEENVKDGSRLDLSVLNELPEDIRKEIMANQDAYDRSLATPNKEKRTEDDVIDLVSPEKNSSSASSSSSALRGDVKVDFEVWNSFPADIKREFREAARRGQVNLPLAVMKEEPRVKKRMGEATIKGQRTIFRFIKQPQRKTAAHHMLQQQKATQKFLDSAFGVKDSKKKESGELNCNPGEYDSWEEIRRPLIEFCQRFVCSDPSLHEGASERICTFISGLLSKEKTFKAQKSLQLTKLEFDRAGLLPLWEESILNPVQKLSISKLGAPLFLK